MIRALYIEKRADTPKVILDAQNNVFEISGRSLPENAERFYRPVLQWMDVYLRNPLEETNVRIELEYFNSSSVKQILNVLFKLEELQSKGCKVKVIWSYNEDDELMEMKGKELESIVDVPFDLQAYYL